MFANSKGVGLPPPYMDQFEKLSEPTGNFILRNLYHLKILFYNFINFHKIKKFLGPLFTVKGILLQTLVILHVFNIFCTEGHR